MNYSFQQKAARVVFGNLLNPSYCASVLCAAPGAGKTTISHIVISMYLNKFKGSRVLVLTHGQNVLKNQYLNDLRNPKIDISFTFGEVGSGCDVEVGIAQSSIEKEYDLVIVDECHEFYLKPMVQGLIKKANPKHQVLLTGSPSEFNKMKQSGVNYGIYYISGSELMDLDVFSDVEMSVIKVGSEGVCERFFEAKDRAVKNGMNVNKLMVAVKTIEEAEVLKLRLLNKKAKVFMSTSENDKDNLEIEGFKKESDGVLIVVCKGILGFSDNLITGLIDLRCSGDVEVSNQLFARVLRVHPNKIKKFYYRVSDKKNYVNEVEMLYKIKSLLTREVFMKYNGKNLIVKKG